MACNRKRVIMCVSEKAVGSLCIIGSSMGIYGHWINLEKLGAGLHSCFGFVKWQLTPRGADRGFAPRVSGANFQDWLRAKVVQGQSRPGSTRNRWAVRFPNDGQLIGGMFINMIVLFLSS